MIDRNVSKAHLADKLEIGHLKDHVEILRGIIEGWEERCEELTKETLFLEERLRTSRKLNESFRQIIADRENEIAELKEWT